MQPEQNTKLYRSYIVTHDAQRWLLSGGRAGLEPRYRVGSLDSGILLCQAYEAYIELHVPAGISFEHAWFLLFALARLVEVGISCCEACGGVRLRDLLAKHKVSCGNCGPGLAPASAAPLIAHAAPC